MLSGLVRLVQTLHRTSEQIYAYISREILDATLAPSVLLLPAFYAGLGPDPVGLSLMHGVDATSYYALKCMVKIIWGDVVVHEALVELWPRMWKWMQLYHHHMYTLPDGLENQIITLNLSILRRVAFRDQDSTVVEEMVDKASGVRVMIAEIWVHYADVESLRRYENPSEDLEVLLTKFLQLDEKENLDAVLTGVGGSMDDLATLVVTTLHAIISDVTLERFNEDWPVRTILFLMRFVSRSDEIILPFLHQGLTQSLVRLTIAMESRPLGLNLQDCPAYDQCIRTLCTILQTEAAYPWVLEALRPKFILVR
ncbi:hypothetical protein C8F04DRAFT_92463 [Mycena alexandri]|uniref:Uncharacterized protein n=1 Tax=Mycena alexandri TaxID=1745969 RepID=A0AAD6SG69_9AGAR|nr:hypothetical protein C8F04DRAFT_92463 [Mycena alexandri]